MSFTIEVEKKGKDEEFRFKDLKLFHRECYGGEIRIGETKKLRLIRENIPLTELECERCGAVRVIKLFSTENRLAIIKLAVEGGEELKLGEDITMIQKIHKSKQEG